MASVTLTSDRFPAGVTVSAYLRSNWPASTSFPSGAPVGSVTSSDTVAADGSVTLTGLAEETAYYAHAEVSGVDRYVSFGTLSSPGFALPAGGTTGEVLTKSSDDDGDATWETAGSASVPDADADTKGKLQLAGDLGGTAAVPTVPGLPSYLAASNDDLLQRKAGAWTNRTPAEVKADLALAKGDVGLGSVDNTADSAKPVSTDQQTALDLKQNAATAATDAELAAVEAALDARLDARESARVYLNHPDLGLALDGVTDDSAAAQAVIDAHDEAVFVLPPGSNMACSNLTPKSHQHWYGYGATITHLDPTPATFNGVFTFLETDGGSTAYTDEIVDVGWYGIKFVGTGAHAAGEDYNYRIAIHLRNGEQIRVRDCTIRDFPGCAILTSDVVGVWIENNTIVDCGTEDQFNAMNVQAWIDGSTHNGVFSITGNHVTGSPAGGIVLHSSVISGEETTSYRATVSNNVVEDSGWVGIGHETNRAGGDVTISNNHVTGVGSLPAQGDGAGIFCSAFPGYGGDLSQSSLVVSGNVIDTGTSSGAGVVCQFSNAVVADNVIRSTRAGIYAFPEDNRYRQPVNVAIRGNLITMLNGTAGLPGIDVAGKRIQVTDNVIYGNPDATTRGHGIWWRNAGPGAGESRISGNVVVNPGRCGIVVDSIFRDSQIADNVILDPNAGSNSTVLGVGIYVNSPDLGNGLTIRGGQIRDRRFTVPLGSTLNLATPFGQASNDTFTSTAHGLSNGDVIRFQTLTGGLGLDLDPHRYYVTDVTTDTFKLNQAQDSTAPVDLITNVTAGSFKKETWTALTSPFGVAATDIFTSTAHGMSNGDQITFRKLTGGTGLTVDRRYFVVGVTTDTFQVSYTSGGSAVNFTSDVSAGSFQKRTLAPKMTYGVYQNSNEPVAVAVTNISGWVTAKTTGTLGAVNLEKLAVANSAAGSTPGTVIKKIQVFDENGASLGYVPVYNAIT